MSDLILSLSHNHRHIAIYAVCVFYGICVFDKHLYLTSCLNAHNHNTCIRMAQTGCTLRKLALFIISQDRQTQVLAAIAMATTIIIE
ncbi:hypothetical protein NP493_161g02043 [Ridgeia piscesae]|uniref:Uncharacterized protein n=1 Tax=Ridgeia piscesae TaxID=27915 RepID=A0AAD9P3R1_RIDPI|nr:hypothetical protein NP493_161g02043 [Ridgeia piscesae]